MGGVSTSGLDLAKSVFQVHKAHTTVVVLLRQKLRQHQVLSRTMMILRTYSLASH